MTNQDASVFEKLRQFPVDSKLKFKQMLPDLVDQKVSEQLFRIVDAMTDEEYSTLIEILHELSAEGTSEKLAEIRYEDYEEIPVDIDTFITDPDYLGKVTKGGTGIYPYWREVLRKIFAPNSPIIEVILTGAIGIGKSTVAVIGMAYVLYRLLCLKNPASYYGLLEGSAIAEAIFNIDLNHVHGQGYGKLQAALKMSPWFIRHGILRGRNALSITARLASGEDLDQSAIDELTYEAGKNINLLVGSKISHFTGFDVFCAFLDEMNFYEKGTRTTSSPESFTDLEIMKVYTAIKRRMESRFMVQGTIPGVIFMISSKKAENDALEVYANKYRHLPSVLVVDEPVWVIKNLPGQYSGNTFNLLVGDKFNKTRVLSTGEDTAALSMAGRRIIQVPVEHMPAFDLNPDQALTDIAGIALVSGSRYIDAIKYRATIMPELLNLFKLDVIESGLGTTDSLVGYVDLNRIPAAYRNHAIYIHLDLSKNKDGTGIGVETRSTEYREVNRLNQGEVVRVRDYDYINIGAVRIQAPKGDMIPYGKIVELLIYLRSAGLNIVGVSMDSYQSNFMQQILIQNGFNTSIVSLDRTPAAYVSYRQALYEGRIRSLDHKVLEYELTELLEDKQTNKIDHPINGSKDVADGVVGAYYSASIAQAKNVSASELARIQEEALDAQLDRELPQQFGRKHLIDQRKNIFAELDKMLDDDDFDN